VTGHESCTGKWLAMDADGEIRGWKKKKETKETGQDRERRLSPREG